MRSGYDYESTYVAMMEGIEQEILQSSVVDVLGNKNLKKTPKRFGKITLCKSHIVSLSLGAMNISSSAQETLCYIGQHLVFREAEDMINNLTDAGISAKQIERVRYKYGQ